MVSKLPWLYWLKTAIPACIQRIINILKNVRIHVKLKQCGFLVEVLFPLPSKTGQKSLHHSSKWADNWLDSATLITPKSLLE